MQSQLPDGWIALQAPDGRWYYAHTPTGQTQWQPPAPTNRPLNYPPPPPPSNQQYVGAPAGYPGGQPAAQSNHSMNQASTSVQTSQYVFDHPVEFKVKEKAFSLSGDGFSVKRVDNGQAVFKVKGSLLSLRESKSLTDTNGRAIYKLNEAIISLRGRMHIIDARTNSTAFCLRKKGFIPHLGTGTIQIWQGSSDEGQPYLQIKGNIFKKDFAVTETATGRKVAQVKRKPFTVSNFLLEKDTYIVRVEPGHDAALMVVLAVAVDEQYRDDGNQSGLF